MRNPDITSLHLEAAIIDQMVAGAFMGKVYCFSAVITNGYALGVAVANEPGYNPILGKTFETYVEAQHWANGLNEHIGLTRDDVLNILASTMGGQHISVVAR